MNEPIHFTRQQIAERIGVMYRTLLEWHGRPGCFHLPRFRELHKVHGLVLLNALNAVRQGDGATGVARKLRGIPKRFHCIKQLQRRFRMSRGQIEKHIAEGMPWYRFSERTHLFVLREVAEWLAGKRRIEDAFLKTQKQKGRNHE